jgi:alkylation response protein AidB-like acyl-CoA dehydrogenase
MDATLTNEQEQIQKTARDYIESEGGIDLARRQMEGEESVIDDLWDDIADLDFTGISVPLEYGGFGEGMEYLSALLEVTGRYALPGPLPETAAFAVPMISELGTDEQCERHLSAIATGEQKFSFAIYDERDEQLPEAITLDVEQVEDGFRLSGTKTLVPYGGEVDHIVVAGRSQDSDGYAGISLFVVNLHDYPVETSRLDSLDRTRPMYNVEFDGLVVEEDSLLGDRHDGGDALISAMDRYAIAASASLVGAAERAVELSTEHGKERKQYGQPVGKYQAVKHRIANMWMDMQNARSLLYYAAWANDEDKPDSSRAVSTLKVYAADRLHRVFGDDMWNHGGMGFTWDHDGHIYLKQAKAWRNFPRAPEHHSDRLIEERLDDT